jgi:restriction system protein
MIPASQEMMFPVLGFFQDDLEKAVKDVRSYIIKKFDITEEEQRIRLPQGSAFLYANRLGWAFMMLKQKGFIISIARGIYKITPKGQDLLKNPPKKLVKQPSPTSQNQDLEDTVDPYDLIARGHRQLKDALKTEILENIKKHDSRWFEFCVRDLLVKMGYGQYDERNTEVTKASRDEGIDIVIKEDKLGLDKIFIQTKRWNDTNAITRPEVQNFAGAINGKGKKGIFVTTSTFTMDARKYADTNPDHTIVLIDGDLLTDLMIEYKLGVVQESDYQTYKIDYTFFEED